MKWLQRRNVVEQGHQIKQHQGIIDFSGSIWAFDRVIPREL